MLRVLRVPRDRAGAAGRLRGRTYQLTLVLEADEENALGQVRGVK